MKINSKIFFILSLSFLTGSIFSFAEDPNTDPQTKALCEKGAAQQKQLGFVENKGQMEDNNGAPVPYVLFNVQVPDLTIWITTSGITYQFYTLKDEDENERGDPKEEEKEKGSGEWHRVDMILKNASIKKENIIAEGDITQGQVNYYKGNCPRGIFDVKKYSKITVQNIYPGIDWVLYAEDQHIKYDIIVHPGADPTQIKLIYEGSGNLEVQQDQIHFKNELGEITEGKLFCYQENKATSITSHYVAEKTGKKIKDGFSNEVSIITAEYNKNKDLVIDPQLIWASYYGGSGLDGPISICRDNSNNIYFTGYEASANFPVLNPGGGAYFQGTLGNGPGVNDLMIVKLNNAGVLISSTYYGGSAGDEGTGITCDASGQLFVSGQTGSSNFPLFNPGGGAYFQNVLSGPRDLFVLRFSTTGVLTWATFYGGSQYEDNGRIVTDNAGNLFVLGATGSNNIPTVNPGGGAYFQAAYGGGAFDAFILKFTPTGVLNWATYYGGTTQDDGLYLNGGTGIAVSATGDIFICGYTNSGASFPILNLLGAYNQPISAGAMEAFILKFNNLGVRQWATFFGGAGNDYGFAVHCDPAGNLYVGGSTNSANIPVVNPGGGAYFQAANGGGNDVFIAEFNSSCASVWCTYYGGSGLDAAYYNMGLDKDASGNLFICGYTNSANLPLANPGCNAYYQPSILGSFTNAFFAKWSNVRALTWATYFGGNFSSDLVLDANGCLFVNGESNINGMATLNPGGGAYFQPAFSSDEGFVIKLCPSTSLTVATTSVNILCNGQCTGTATATPTGCASPFTYSWNTNPVQTTQIATGLCAGNYTVVVTDALSNTVTGIVTVTEPTALVASIPTITHVNCNGQCTGDATASATGGTPSYIYSWSNSQTGVNATGLCAGTYSVFVTDANGCTDTMTTIITEPTALVATVTRVNICCFGNCNGSATANVSGGTPGYTYVWSPGNQTTQSNTGLCAGNYTVNITDANGCTSQQTVTITQPAPFVANANATNSSICPSNCTDLNGSATGGIAPYTYSWAPGGMTTDTVNVCPTATTTYTCFATDSGGCCVSNVQVTVTISGLTITASSTQAICTSNTGTATANPSNGTSPYTYLWSNAQTNQTATGLVSGTYTVTITDANGCTGTQTVTVTSTNSPITITTSSTLAGCTVNNGTATANPSNGTSPYTYLWSNSQTAQTATGLAPGTYTVTITDANGCTGTQTVTINLPPAITVIVTTTTSACSTGTGTATAVASNGTGPYNYSWSNGQTWPISTGMSAGFYFVIVTDANGCSQTQTFNIGNTPGPTATASATALATGSQLNATGGGTYLWSPSAGLSCTTCANPIATPGQTTTYCVLVTDANGCTDLACVTVTVDQCATVQLSTLLPNAFSPNGDLSNDNFCVPSNTCIKTFLLRVYDRWGEKVFESDNVNKCWNGIYKDQALNTDVFVYYFMAELTNGESFSQKGNISLVK